MTIERGRVRTERRHGAVRRAWDVVGGAVLVLVLLPVLLGVAAAIRLTSRGPVLFRQQRVGERRNEFTMYKFRTMVVDCDDRRHRDQIEREVRGEDTSVDGSWKLDGDPRVTVVGGFLRRTSLDELPQLLNVLRGEMALVGPRPCLPWEADLFPPPFQERFTVRPGLTGLWQVSGRSTMGTLEMLELDLRYVRTRTALVDLAILLRTPQALLRDGGAR